MYNLYGTKYLGFPSTHQVTFLNSLLAHHSLPAGSAFESCQVEGTDLEEQPPWLTEITS